MTSIEVTSDEQSWSLNSAWWSLKIWRLTWRGYEQTSWWQAISKEDNDDDDKFDCCLKNSLTVWFVKIFVWLIEYGMCDSDTFSKRHDDNVTRWLGSIEEQLLMIREDWAVCCRREWWADDQQYWPAAEQIEETSDVDVSVSFNCKSKLVLLLRLGYLKPFLAGSKKTGRVLDEE